MCSWICTLIYVFAISVQPLTASLGDYLHDYVKSGRSVDGPFPALNNAPYYCYQVPNKGPCGGMNLVWFYDLVRRKCMPMFYSGCGGNENRFNSKPSCQLHCEKKRRL